MNIYTLTVYIVLQHIAVEISPVKLFVSILNSFEDGIANANFSFK